MRKHQQRQILELLQTIGQAQSDRLYADCQDGVVSIGEYIESIEGEGTHTVALLEEYHELLYKASNNEVSEKQLNKQLMRIEKSIKNELKPKRIEIVFLSYKAAMFDAFESVYTIAKNDPQCDVFVVAMPYYAFGADGTLGEMQYEKDSYLDHIHITHWEDYDIESRHPDIIFTHYPYDNNVSNYTIHPYYYSKRLKKNCELLVHIPYYVIMGDVLPDYYVSLMGVVHADYMIVQSEETRKTCIEQYRELDKQNKWNGAFGIPEKKFLALGSPKFDKVINSKREDYALPEEWQRLLMRPDGTRTKVVLYNTHMWTWIRYGSEYTKKTCSVFNAFRESRDIVLWWRPHPNTEMNIRIKRPDLLEEFLETIETYRREGFGIYDDTADLHRAITWADAYYGDFSSLVVMFGVTGKPVVIQDIFDVEDSINLRFADFAIDNDGVVWAFELLEDGLFKLNFEDSTASLILRSGATPYYQNVPLQTHRYVNIYCMGDEVISFPCFLDNILVYNRVTGDTATVPLDYNYRIDGDYSGFILRHTVVYQGKIYAFGAYSKAVVVYDAVSREVYYDIVLLQHIGLLIDTEEYVKSPIYFSEPSETGEVIMLMKNCEHLIKYTLHTQEVEFIASNPIIAECIHADFDGEHYWLISENNDKLIKWEPIQNEITEFCMNDYGFPQEESVFSGITDFGDYLLLFPGYGSKFLSFDKHSMQFGEFDKVPKPIENSNEIFNYDAPKKAHSKLYAFARAAYTLCELDKITGDVKQYKFSLSDEGYDSYIRDYFDNIPYVITGSAIGNPARFFSRTLSGDSYINNHQRENLLRYSINKDGTAGEAIHKTMKSEIMSI